MSEVAEGRMLWPRVDESETEPVDAAHGVREDDGRGGRLRRERREAAKAPGAAVVPNDAWVLSAIGNHPAEPNLDPAADARVWLLRERERRAGTLRGRLQACREEPQHLLGARPKARGRGHEILDRRARLAAPRMTADAPTFQIRGDLNARRVHAEGAQD